MQMHEWHFVNKVGLDKHTELDSAWQNLCDRIHEDHALTRKGECRYRRIMK